MVSAAEGEDDRGTVSEHVVNGDANYLDDFVTVLGSTPTKPAADLDPKTAARIAKGTELSDGFISVFKDDWGIPSPQLTQLKSDLASAGDDLMNFFADKGENGLKAWEGLFNTSLRIDIPWLTRASKWIDEGGDFVGSGGKTWFRKNGDDIFEIKNEKILPNKKSNYHQGADETPIGDPANGYQVVKVGDYIKVKRVPDESPYVNTSYHTKLTEHPNAHVLERHGHDVTDDALIKRANEGIAPDGSTINPNPPFTKPPYSSKFEGPDAVKAAYDNTKPGTTAFNNTPLVNGRKTVYHTLPSGSGSYGKGVPRDGSTFQTATKVRAVYQDMGGGNFQLLTMFPDF